MIRSLLTALLMVDLGLVLCLPFKKTDISALRRNTRSAAGTGKIPCIHMQSTSGKLQYTSDGNPEVCGLYLIGEPDQLVEVEFLDFSIKCETSGLLAMFDGWELEGELFPDSYDHPLTMAERYTTYCGEHAPHKLFVSSQNVALIQFRVPMNGEGFRIMVNFKPNPQPCNMMAMFDMGVLTMKNYGLRRNCSTSIIYPETISLLNVDVGITSQVASQVKGPEIEAETGLNSKCMKYGSGDYVQLMNGHGLDAAYMTTRSLLCGAHSSGTAVSVTLGCQHTMVRLVSSGEFHNTVTFQFAPPQPDHVTPSDFC